jgi:LPS-assembly protein
MENLLQHRSQWGWKTWCRGAAAVVLAGAVLGVAEAQQPVAVSVPAETVAAVTPAAGLIDIQADSLSYDAARRVVIARGGVKVTRGTDSVSADYAEVDTAAEKVYARGNILIEYLGNVWKGEEATYNFRTGEGDFGTFEAYAPPYHLTARDSRRASPRLMELDGLMLTTCEPDNPEYSIRASSATLEDNRILRAKNVRFQLGPVPFFWFPYVRANIEELAKFEFTPGWSSSMGPFLLTAYNQPINDVLRSRTHVDVRQKRGLGLGQDFLWKDPDGAYDGMVRLYYTRDSRPWKDDNQRLQREELIDEQRYWLQLRDRHNLTDRDYLITELNYVSDPWLLNDFFDDEYQKNVQPENRVTLSHRGDRYTAGVGLNLRLNDFYGNVNRLPEVFLNFNRQQIFETPLYYEGANTLSYLDRVYPDHEDREGYDAFRFDTYNMVYWPTRQFGFLSVMPRAGYRGTFYSKTIERSVVTNVVAVTNDLGVVIGTTNVVEELLRDGDAVWRSLPELGVESSFKAFGDLYRGPTGIEQDEDLRHIAEPYANYTLRFEPNALPGELWQFDGVDRLDYRNDLRLGMRNYLQTKRRGSPHNLIYADVFSTLNMDPDEDQEALGDIGFRTEWRPISWFKWDFDGAYDTQDSSVRTFSTQAEVRNGDLFTVGVDYRLARDVRELVAGDLTLFPGQRWSGRVYVRMDLEDSQVEEHSYYVVHRTRCLGIGLGLRVRPEQDADSEDNYTVWFRIWPLAFPSFASSIGN